MVDFKGPTLGPLTGAKVDKGLGYIRDFRGPTHYRPGINNMLLVYDEYCKKVKMDTLIIYFYKYVRVLGYYF